LKIFILCINLLIINQQKKKKLFGAYFQYLTRLKATQFLKH